MEHAPGFLAYVAARRSSVTEVSVHDARDAVAAHENARLLDVREDREWQAGHAVGAQHVARGVLERDIERLVPDASEPLYLYCGGGYRSILACATLQEMGYSHVYSISGGWRAWEDANAPTTTDDVASQAKVG